MDEPDKYNVTKEKVLDMLYEDRALAKAEGKAAACLSVTKLFGDTIGMFSKQDDKKSDSLSLTFTEADRCTLEMFYGRKNKAQE